MAKRAAASLLIDPLHRAIACLADAPVITLGSLKGVVAGAGVSITLLDLTIAARNAVF